MTESTPSPVSDPSGWVTTHGDALFAYCLQRVRDRSTAEDLVQETFLAALQGAAGFRGDAAERTWLIGILRNKLVDHHRRRARERTGELGDVADPVVDGAFDHSDHFKVRPGAWAVDAGRLDDDREFWVIFHGCLASMPTRLAAVFSLRVLEEAEPETVCQELDVTVTNMWVMLHRARARLRACLEERWFGKE